MVPVVLIFRAKTLVLSAEILKNNEGLHVGFLRQVMGMNTRRLGDKTWEKEGPDRVMQSTVTKPLRYYIDKQQSMLAE